LREDCAIAQCGGNGLSRLAITFAKKLSILQSVRKLLQAPASGMFFAAIADVQIDSECFNAPSWPGDYGRGNAGKLRLGLMPAAPVCHENSAAVSPSYRRAQLIMRSRNRPTHPPCVESTPAGAVPTDLQGRYVTGQIIGHSAAGVWQQGVKD
jgi:hypothetical protein